jgi:SAM-dependent methyltransferase
MATGEDIETFWDERARENALYFVDNELAYNDPDEDHFWAEGDVVVDNILELFDVQIAATNTVLDIGCGVGRLTRALAHRAAEVTGTDVSGEMLTQAREHNASLANVTWLKGDGVSLAGVPDAGVDACLCWVVFQHIPDPQITLGYIREIGRVLRPGGWAAFQVSNDPGIHRERQDQRSIGSRLRRLTGRAPSGQNDPRWLGAAVDLDAVRAAAADGGLQIEAIENPGTQYCLVLVRRPAAA